MYEHRRDRLLPFPRFLSRLALSVLAAFGIVSAALLLGVVYTFGTLRCAVDLRAINAYWALFALSLNWVGDIAAFYVGRAIGRHKLAPRISPGKSWEGAIASVAGSMIYAAIYFPKLMPDVPLPEAILIAAAGNVAGQIGDLSESVLKRGAGVKDSGNLLPGHGGWLDRLSPVDRNSSSAPGRAMRRLTGPAPLSPGRDTP